MKTSIYITFLVAALQLCLHGAESFSVCIHGHCIDDSTIGPVKLNISGFSINLNVSSTGNNSVNINILDVIKPLPVLAAKIVRLTADLSDTKFNFSKFISNFDTFDSFFPLLNFTNNVSNSQIPIVDTVKMNMTNMDDNNSTFTSNNIDFGLNFLQTFNESLTELIGKDEQTTSSLEEPKKETSRVDEIIKSLFNFRSNSEQDRPIRVKVIRIKGLHRQDDNDDEDEDDEAVSQSLAHFGGDYEVPQRFFQFFKFKRNNQAKRNTTTI